MALIPHLFLSTAACALLLLGNALCAEGAGQSYGDGVSGQEPTSIAEILADPDRYAGKEVQVRGLVAGVCPMKGCWMELTDEEARLRIKVEDDVIVFPPEAEGRWAVARGTVELIDMTREQYVGWRHHLAEELGQDLDESSLPGPPYRLVQISGTGAEIEGP